MTELPKGWATAKFSNFGEWMGGGTPSKAVPSYWNGPIPWVSPKDMKTKVIRSAIDGITEAAVENSAAKRVPAGSVLIVARSGILAHTLPIAVTAVEATLNQDMKALTLSGGISSDFIAWGLRAFEQAILNKCRKGGTTVHSIEMPSLVAFELPIPPTNEQRRIVEKIEAMFERIDKGIENLRGAKATLALYRQSLLKSAFEGKLTADWRAQNADKLEPPKTLLARIQKERETRYKSALDDWQTALAKWRAGGEVGRKPGKPSRPEPQTVVTPAELEQLPDLPKEWMFTKLANLGDLGRGKSKHRPRNDKRLFDGRYPFIQTGEVKAANRFIREFTATYSDFGLEQSKLWPAGTLCITIAANIAQTAFLTFEACFPDSIVGFTAFSGGVSPEYVEYFIASARLNIEAYAPATAQKNINLNTLETLNIPICSPAEQAEITRILDTRLTAADRMEADIDAALSRADALRQSILKRAFSGNLVPQDPSDEPAPTLLARIKAERAKAGKTAKRKTAHAS